MLWKNLYKYSISPDSCHDKFKIPGQGKKSPEPELYTEHEVREALRLIYRGVQDEMKDGLAKFYKRTEMLNQENKKIKTELKHAKEKNALKDKILDLEDKVDDLEDIVRKLESTVGNLKRNVRRSESRSSGNKCKKFKRS